MPTKSYSLIHERSQRARATKFNSLPIFQAISNFKAAPQNNNLTTEQQRLIDKFILEGKLNGFDLNVKDKVQLGSTLTSLAAEKLKFKQKVDISINQFAHIIRDYNIVREFPLSLLQAISIDPMNPTQGPWKITLQSNIYNNFLEYCPDAILRWNVWQANVRKASIFNDRHLETSTHLEKIRDYRHRQAKHLGYENFVEMSMETKMAGSVEKVQTVLNNLVDVALPAQVTELKMLNDYASTCGAAQLQEYDIPYWKRRHLKATHHFEDELVREYFPLPKVLNSIFSIFERIFQIKVIERTGMDTWHEDVKFYDIIDLSTNNTTNPIAGFYLDLYSRKDDKIRTQDVSGWMVGITNRCQVTNTIPLSALIFNFQEPLYGKPSLLTVGDLDILFKKFGHALQHLLTQVNYSELAGLSNIEWDAVEICSHVMSHLLFESEVLKSISSHYSTEETIPVEMLNAIQEQRKHLSGYKLCRELYFAELDLQFHMSSNFWLEIVKKVWPKYHVMELNKKDAHPCSLTSIFAAEWGAAYFSHIWSRLVAADVYSAFHEVKDNPEAIIEVGKRFRSVYFSLGGSCHPSEVFRRFRGRDPSSKALLKTLGLDSKNINKNETN